MSSLPWKTLKWAHPTRRAFVWWLLTGREPNCVQMELSEETMAHLQQMNRTGLWSKKYAREQIGKDEEEKP